MLGNMVQARSDAWQPACGNYSAELSGSVAGDTSWVEQTLTGLSTGLYQFNFSYAGNPSCGQTQWFHVLIQIGDCYVVDEEIQFDTSGTSPTNMGWKSSSMNFFIYPPFRGTPFNARFVFFTYSFGCGPVLDCVQVTRLH
eukprot:TRINITY_DN1728_c0_g1_i1.p1 TRINITY_DN1728_c0_g1~~TRINITY_DN1728_c0_g1_i1.p1  ORF type:complete len:140 (-),score=19.53 TRINITY_DN1728_c0_g1_i1:71-490(-)